jgi:hypothetical protein
MNRQHYQQGIIKALTWLSAEVSVNNSMNFTDINVHSEYFYRDLLNLAFGFKLKNMNILEPNAAAIDLGDIENRFAIQVTSTSSLEKTKKTVNKFIEKGLHLKYDRLVVLNIVEKIDHRITTIGNENYTLDTKSDIWDIKTLASKFNDGDDQQLHTIHQFLNENLHLKPNGAPPKNTATILKLIELISDEEHPEVGEGFIVEPFPTEKIHERFKDHSDFITSEYISLYKDYGSVLNSVENVSDFGQVKLRRASQYLRIYSDAVLTECNGNPKVALDKIVLALVSLVQKHNIEADAGAAKFYILKQLISCNIFPNKVALNV